VRTIKCKAILFSLLLCLIAIGNASNASADAVGKKDYVADCAHCHGLDGKGGVPEMRMVPGYIAVDLTQLAKENSGQFPRQKVYDTIKGRKRFPAHFRGDMPTWGLEYQEDNQNLSPEEQEKVRRGISALVDYIESLQEK